MALALPAMEAATKALESLNKNDINELRVFLKPPRLVVYTMESVCMLLGAKYKSQTNPMCRLLQIKHLQERLANS